MANLDFDDMTLGLLSTPFSCVSVITTPFSLSGVSDSFSNFLNENLDEI